MRLRVDDGSRNKSLGEKEMGSEMKFCSALAQKGTVASRKVTL